MKVTIYGSVRKTPRTHRLWVGELSMLPRPDDFLCLDTDRGSFVVRSVEIIVPTNEACITVWMNADDDFPHLKD